jgi:hypothetical protein
MSFPTSIIGVINQDTILNFELNGIHAISVLPDLVRFDIPGEGLVTFNEAGISADIERLVRTPDGRGGFIQEWQAFSSLSELVDAPESNATVSDQDQVTYLQTGQLDFTDSPMATAFAG